MKKIARLKKNLLPYFLILPAVTWIFIIVIYPTMKNFHYSFTNALLLRPNFSFIGLENYKKLFSDPQFYRALINSFSWTISVMVFQHVVGMLFALLLNREFKGRGVLRALMLLPWITPVIVLALVWRWLYSDLYGVFNYYLMKLNLISQPIGFLGNSSTAMASVVLAAVWHGFPFAMIIGLAGLESIPKELYEVGRIDGASRWKLFIHITLPGLRNIILISVLLLTIWTFNDFSVMFLFTKGGPGYATFTLPIFAYFTSFQGMRTGFGATIVVQIILILTVVSILFSKARRKVET